MMTCADADANGTDVNMDMNADVLRSQGWAAKAAFAKARKIEMSPHPMTPSHEIQKFDLNQLPAVLFFVALDFCEMAIF